MSLHKEGKILLISLLLSLIFLNFLLFYFFVNSLIIRILAITFSVIIFSFFTQFFRVPTRESVLGENIVVSPADGKIVVIEEVEETEYFNDKRIQVSIFMSPWNVHINWFPISGVLKYYKYHKGLFLFANNPKSSTENERNTIVVKHSNNTEIMFRQIAGIVARRIVFYPEVNSKVKQCDQFGFIKFGSRVDIFLPLGTKINVKLNDKVTGTQTVIAEI